MEALILLIIFGLGAAYFATQNTGTVHILLGSFLINGIPLYVVVIGSVLIGVFISWLVSLANTFSILYTLHGKDAALKKSEDIIEKLQERNKELEMKLAAIPGSEKNEAESTNEKEGNAVKPALLHNLKHGLNFSFH